MIEVWKSIDGYDGYCVSNLGRVKRLKRHVKTVHGAYRQLDERIMKCCVLNTGYMQVMLPGRKKISVHRLVADAFVEKKSGNDVVNHIDGNKLNNSADNLEWTTFAGNNLHAFRSLGRRPSCLGVFGSKHPTSKAVVSSCEMTGKVEYFGCASDAVRKYGFDSGAISKCCAGIQDSHKGFRWRYA